MTNRELEAQLKTALHKAAFPVRPAHFQETLSLVSDELRKHPARKRLSYWEFLGTQVRFIGWKIWLFQALTLLLLGCLSYSLRQSFLDSPRSAGLLLSCCSLLISMTALPFLHRSRRYRMCEVEMAARFSIIKQLGARLLILSIGDFAMLCSLFCFTLAKTALPRSSVFLYLLLPYLTATSGMLYLIRHTPSVKWAQNSVLVCGSLFLLFSLLTAPSPLSLPEPSSPVWGIACLVMAACCLRQTHFIFAPNSLEKIQFL